VHQHWRAVANTKLLQLIRTNMAHAHRVKHTRQTPGSTPLMPLLLRICFTVTGRALRLLPNQLPHEPAAAAVSPCCQPLLLLLLPHLWRVGRYAGRGWCLSQPCQPGGRQLGPTAHCHQARNIRGQPPTMCLGVCVGGGGWVGGWGVGSVCVCVFVWAGGGCRDSRVVGVYGRCGWGNGVSSTQHRLGSYACSAAVAFLCPHSQGTLALC
jgi:hypothetical protein